MIFWGRKQEIMQKNLFSKNIVLANPAVLLWVKHCSTATPCNAKVNVMPKTGED
jgi:hypothetical protein